MLVRLLTKRIVTLTLVALVQIYTVTFLYQDTLLTTLLLAVSSVVLLWKLGWTRVHVLSFVLIGVAGFAAEAVVVTRGAWVYADQHILGLPVWLPILWGSVGVMSVWLTEKINQKYG